MNASISERINFVGLLLWAAGALCGEGLAFAGAILCFLALLVDHRAARLKPHLLGFTAVLGFGLYCVATARGALHPLRPGAPWSAFHVGMFPLAILAWRRAPASDRRRVEGVLLGVVLVSSALAWAQHFALLGDASWLARIRPTYRMREPGPYGGFTAGGLHFHRLKYAHTLVALGLATLPSTLPAICRNPARAAGVGVLLGAALFWTHTSAATGAAAVGGVAYAIGYYADALRRRWSAWGTVALAGLLPPVFALTLPFPADRHIAWKTAMALFEAHPFMGVGYGAYPKNALEVMGGINPEHPLLHMDAHAVGLQILAELGGVGLAWAALLIFCYARLLRRDGRGLSAAFIATLAGVATLSVVHNFWFHGVVTSAVALAFAMAASGPCRTRACLQKKYVA